LALFGDIYFGGIKMENKRAGFFSSGRIIVFISFIAMFLILLQKDISHTGKAIFTMFAFFLMVVGVLLETKFSENISEKKQFEDSNNWR
jgi:hypothetical protein